MALVKAASFALPVLFGGLAAPQSRIDPCVKDTGGTCNVLSCGGSRGPTMCLDGKCMCPLGYCAVAGVCQRNCEGDTGASCRTSSCDSRSKASCKDGRCICGAKQCSVDQHFDQDDNGETITLGVCKDMCQAFTGGTCHLFGCAASRMATCSDDGFCVCEDGKCAESGVCKVPFGRCDKDTGGTCRIFGCSPDRGPTDCVDGLCKCSKGYCQRDGRCSKLYGLKGASEMGEYESSLDRSLGSIRLQTLLSLSAALVSGAVAALIAVKIIQRRNSQQESMAEPLILS